ncbi:hypothetical protein BpHYR1_033866 [Brachionus plicatilis]|uniref:Uncharacterized protein n=1 Tax=Brachionus plicatilis TaxID=10195 RepID=A0A3M7RUV8_BRAPC|nr:hypothetical protein BpHYR1_033866 [Brachionus plicatilis]
MKPSKMMMGLFIDFYCVPQIQDLLTGIQYPTQVLTVALFQKYVQHFHDKDGFLSAICGKAASQFLRLSMIFHYFEIEFAENLSDTDNFNIIKLKILKVAHDMKSTVMKYINPNPKSSKEIKAKNRRGSNWIRFKT